MRPQFEFYRRMLKAAELRTQVYWGHAGACFTEQIENFGLPVAFEYGWKRPADFDPGLQYNAWLEYSLGYGLGVLLDDPGVASLYRPGLGPYLPLIESCLVFFDERYQALAKARTPKALDQDGHLVLYPSTACETYKMATTRPP